MFTVKQVEQLLFEAFPAKDATPGDRVGLLAGDTKAEVKGIALALDAKVANIEEAAAAGCNVLVSHHPAFWPPPTEFLREGPSAGAAIYRAAERGVALISMHTNLDCAPIAREMLLEPAGFMYAAPLALPSEAEHELQNTKGRDIGALRAIGESLVPTAALGQIGIPKEGEAVLLSVIASRYKETFGAIAKAWGDPEKPVRHLATCSGGGGSLIQRVISTGADCYVTGEVAYHEALELAAAGVALIELGHDRSELPYRFYLRDALLQAGFAAEMLHVLGPTTSWWQ